jgi:hypothetical protein
VGRGRYLRPAAGHVVPQRVVGQVGGQALGQPRVSGGRRRAEFCLEPHVAPCGLLALGLRDAGGEVGEVERLPALDAPFPAREGEQRVDEALGPCADRQDLLAGLPQGCRVGHRVVEGHLQQGSLDRERGAQFV